MKEARAHGSAVQQGGLAACAHEKQPQLQDEQLGGSSAEDAARADKRQGPPSSAAGAPRSLPELQKPEPAPSCNATNGPAAFVAAVASSFLGCE